MSVATTVDVALEAAPEAPRLDLLRRIFFGRTSTITATIIIVAFIAVAIFAPQLAPYDPLAQSYLAINALPTSEHWLGTDQLGRDVFSRLIHGSRNSLIFGLIAPTLAAFFGTLLGVVEQQARHSTRIEALVAILRKVEEGQVAREGQILQTQAVLLGLAQLTYAHLLGVVESSPRASEISTAAQARLRTLRGEG